MSFFSHFRDSYERILDRPWKTWLFHWFVALALFFLGVLVQLPAHAAAGVAFGIMLGRENEHIWLHWRDAKEYPRGTRWSYFAPYVLDGIMDLLGPAAVLLAVLGA